MSEGYLALESSPTDEFSYYQGNRRGPPSVVRARGPRPRWRQR